ncbi:hypothetical protein A2803_05985 [Candidatus Woesebacteria bacterium RIFCSPHIGHO2_01_FULL_44_21]|uniref:ABC transporter ATP-binding protein n=1 Tax=Candidatus Woesebacteria bacterium RIFCSPHIGHO2_01_FULL_44_21 TaxID=1802503 RepID=A0A1F7Z077_9BACT|nr:MAG: hypothetical protein A2803_05985 [Candidatus Woesebacteria bacterium RIFCSPHIGHO2_01_FULL_44_21]OGM71071.1 MAG: hypothetical protein A2897_02440 [Candidatus Woesebacteria bacterium RIFCSPLOWO2_01_FULL_44_24b]
MLAFCMKARLGPLTKQFAGHFPLMLNILRVYYRYLARRRFIFGLVLLLIVVSAILHSLTPYFYKLFVDKLPDLNEQVLINILVVYVIVRLVATGLSALTFQLGDLLLIDAASDTRIDVFKKVHDLDFAFHASKSTGSLISAVKRGDGSYFNLFHAIHFRIFWVVIEFFVMFFFLSALDIRIGLSIGTSVFALLLTIKFIIGKNIRIRTLFNRAEDDVSDVIVDNFVNFETVKLFAKENWERARLQNVFGPWKKHLWDYGISFRYFDLSVGGIMTVGIFITLFLSLRLALNNEITIGDFVLVAGFTASFYPQIFDLVFALRDIAKNFVDMERYFGLLDENILVKDSENPLNFTQVKGEIIFDNVYFSYKGGQKNALKGVSLTIRQGQSIALVGRSGGGKTTMVKALMRFYDLDSGKIEIDDIDISKVTKQELRSHMGVVPQEPILFNNTIGYNIKYGSPEATNKELIAAAKMANIHDFIETMPKGYNTNVGERGIKLSGGQKQRVAIARMILADPDIIIFDEATSHLDSESEKLIQDAFWRASKNKTTIIIAHRLSTVMKADKIVVMSKGKIKEIGTHGELLDKEGSLYKYLWDLQTKAH